MAASLPRQVLGNLAERIDEGLPSWVFQAISVETDSIRRALDRAGLARVAPDSTEQPTLSELDRSAETLISQAVGRAGIRGAIGGVVGLIGIPPEGIAALVQTTRLAQRLAIVYGHDPHSDRGATLVTRAIASAHDLDLPEQRTQEMRVRDLPMALRGSNPDTHRTGPWLLRTLTRSATVGVGRHVGRSIPGFGSGWGALAARRTMRKHATHIRDLMARACTVHQTTPGELVDALEVVLDP